MTNKYYLYLSVCLYSTKRLIPLFYSLLAYRLRTFNPSLPMWPPRMPVTLQYKQSQNKMEVSEKSESILDSV